MMHFKLVSEEPEIVLESKHSLSMNGVSGGFLFEYYTEATITRTRKMMHGIIAIFPKHFKQFWPSRISFMEFSMPAF